MEALQAALLSVFPTYGDLEQFLGLKMHIQLGHITAEEGLDRVSFKLLQRFQADGAQIKTLVRLLWENYPSNPEVRALVLSSWDHYMPGAPDKRALQEMTSALRSMLQTYRVSSGKEREELESKIEQIRQSMRTGDDLRPGEILGEPPRYQLLERVGSPWTEVWKAADVYSTEADSFVAVKVLLAAQAKDPDKLKWFQDSAEEARRTRHENMIEILVPAGCHCNQFHFMVMSWARGGNLQNAVLKRRHTPGENPRFLPAREALESVLQAGDAIAALHRRRIIHGAITPKNILLDITDNGVVALLAEPSPSGFSFEGDYAAPELHGDAVAKAPSERSDQFSLALVALFALRPSESMEPAAVSELESERLRTVLSMALSDDPQKRYDSVAQFCKELKEAREQSKASELQRPEDAARILEMLLSVPPGKRERTRANLIAQMKLPAETIRPVTGDAQVRSPELQWRHLLFDLLVTCREGRLGELGVLANQEMASNILATGSVPQRSTRRRESFSPSRLLALLCRAPEGTVEAVGLHLGLWNAVSPDQTTLSARARSLLHDALEKYGSLEETTRALHEVSEPQEARARTEQSPWLHEETQPPWLHEELVFAVERATRLFAPRDLGAPPSPPPEGLMRVIELTNLKDYWWLQSELGAVWREMVRSQRRLRRPQLEKLYESFDDMDRALRRLIVLCPRLTRPALEVERWFGLYRALSKLSPALFHSVVKGCGVPAWALPGPEEAPAWSALHLVHWCQSWSRPEHLSDVLSQRLQGSTEPPPRGEEPAQASNEQCWQERLLDWPSVHFAELLLFLGEPLDSSFDLQARVEQLIERHGPDKVPSSPLSVACQRVAAGLPSWPTTIPVRAEPPEQLRDELPGRLWRLSSEQLEAVASGVGMREEFLPSRAASPARRAMELLAYCQPFSGALALLADRIDQARSP